MKDGYKDGLILSNLEISPNIYEIILEGNFQGQPGQFYMVRGWDSLDPFLPRPLSIANLEDNKITFLYEVRGRGTHLVSKLSRGDKLSILGPLGNGFPYKMDKRIALVSGGIGIAPMYYLARVLKSIPDFYAGFRNNTYYLDAFSPFVENVFVSTEDGSKGHKGYIIDILEPEKYDLIYTCGPLPMMEALLKKSKGYTQVYVSMENRMACGIGACLGCTIETIRGLEKVCKEGPVFLGEEVILND